MDNKIVLWIQEIKEKQERLKDLAGKHIRTIDVPSPSSHDDDQEELPLICRLLMILLPDNYRVVKVSDSKENVNDNLSVEQVKSVITLAVTEKIKKIVNNEWEEEFIAPKLKIVRQYVESLSVDQVIKEQAMQNLNYYERIKFPLSFVSDTMDEVKSLEGFDVAKQKIIDALSKAIDLAAEEQINSFEKVNTILGK